MFKKVKIYALTIAILLIQAINPVVYAEVLEYNSDNKVLLFGYDLPYITQEGGTFYNGTLTTTYTGERSHYVHGTNAALYIRPYLKLAGRYKVYMWNIGHTNNYTDTPDITVHAKDGDYKTTIPLKTGESRFYELGEYNFDAGYDGYIEIPVKGTVMYDYFKFELIAPEDGSEVVNQYDISEIETLEEWEYERRNIPERAVAVPDVKENAIKIYVTPDGSGDGSRENPFGEISDAQNKAREIISRGYPEDGVAVMIKGGVYELDQTISFTSADSGTEKSPVIYEAYDGDVTLTLGKKVETSEFEELTEEERESIPSEGRGKVKKIDLRKSGINHIDFVNDAAIPFVLVAGEDTYQISRYPNGTGQDAVGIIEELGLRSNNSSSQLRGTTYSIANPRMLRWANEKNPMVSGMFGPEYRRLQGQISNINTTDMTVANKFDSFIVPTENAEYYAYNLLSEVDMPGEFYIDTETLYLYYYPMGDNEEDMFLNFKSDVLVKFSDRASNIILKNISLTCGGTGFEFENETKNCVAAGGTISGMSQVGVLLYGENNVIRDYDIYNVYGSAIRIEAGDEYKYIKANNKAENNIIHNVSKKGSEPAIYVDGCGNKAIYNHIYDVPDKGIGLSGNGNIIEWNRIERCCLENSDTGAIYIINYGMGYGTSISHNFIRDVFYSQGSKYAAGIYIDDYTCGINVEGNVIINPATDAFAFRGSNIVGDNNLIIGEKTCKGLTSRITGRLFKDDVDTEGHSRAERGILACDIENVPEFAEALADLKSSDMGVARNHTLTDNIVFNMAQGTKDTDLKHYADNYGTYNCTDKGTVYIDGLPECNLDTLEDLSLDYLRSLTPDFEELNISEMGIYKGGMRTDTDDVVVKNEPIAFDALSPVDNAEGLGSTVIFEWDAVSKLGYTDSIFIIAEDETLNKNQFVYITPESKLELKVEAGKTYYWTVLAQAFRGDKLLMCKSGVRKFSTISEEHLVERELFKAKTLVKDTSCGDESYLYEKGSKNILIDVISSVENRVMQTDEEKEKAISDLELASNEYISKRHSGDNMIITMSHNFQSDFVGQQPYAMIKYAAGYVPIYTEYDPTNSLNKVAKFVDTNKEGNVTSTQGGLAMASYHTVNGTMSFRRQTGKVEISASVMMDKNESSCFSLGLAKAGGRIAGHRAATADNFASVNFSTDGKIYGSNTKKYPLLSYEKGRWYNIKIDFDGEKGVYDVYVDGEKKAEDIPAYMNVTDNNMPGQVVLSCTDGNATDDIRKTTGIYYVDNILVKIPEEQGENCYLSNITINGEQLEGFMLDKFIYCVNMSDEDFERMVLGYECDESATVTIWEKDSRKFIGVLSGDKRHIEVYSIENNGLEG